MKDKRSNQQHYALARQFDSANSPSEPLIYEISESAWRPAINEREFGKCKSGIPTSTGDRLKNGKIFGKRKRYRFVSANCIICARVDAAKLVDHVCNKLGRDPGPCPTTRRTFPWRPEGRYRSWQQQTLSRSLRLGLDEEAALACQLRYGCRFEVLLRMIEKLPRLARRFVPEAPVCIGELVFCSRYEMVANLQDLLRRRLPLTLITTLPEQRVRLAAAIAGKILRWSKQRQAVEVRSICGEISRS